MQENKLLKKAEILFKTHLLANDLTITPSNGHRASNGSSGNHTSPPIKKTQTHPMNLSMSSSLALNNSLTVPPPPPPPQQTPLPSIVSNAGYKRPRQIFTLQQEEQLAAYVRDTANYYSGLSSKEVRIMAFVYGVCNQVEMPVGWRESHQASFDWCIGFIKRNKLSPMVVQGLSYKSNNNNNNNAMKSQQMQLPKLAPIRTNSTPNGTDEKRATNETNVTSHESANCTQTPIEIDD